MSERVSTSIQSPRIKWIDMSRGVAIVLVVLGHVIGNAQAASTISGHTWEIIHDIIYSFHMPLFFFMSGCVNYKKSIFSYRDCIRTYGIRFASLLIPYVIFSTLYLALKVFTEKSGAVLHPVSFIQILDIWKEPIGLYWFLYSLMAFTIIDCLLQLIGLVHGGVLEEYTEGCLYQLSFCQ